MRRYDTATLEAHADRFLQLAVTVKQEMHPGEAVQVHPIKPKLKATGTVRLKLNFDNLLSNVAFKFNLRRYTPCGAPSGGSCRQGLTLVHFSAQSEPILSLNSTGHPAYPTKGAL